LVKSLLIWGAERWLLYGDERRRISGTEMDVLRGSARICKVERKTNEYVRGKWTRQIQ
jgi:hypothetical protein